MHYKDWRRFSWSVLECPLYTKEIIEEARTKGDMYFDIFYLGKPYPLIGTMIGIEDIKKCSRGVTLFEYDEEFGYSVLGCDWGWCYDEITEVLTDKGWKKLGLFSNLKRILYFSREFEDLNVNSWRLDSHIRRTYNIKPTKYKN